MTKRIVLFAAFTLLCSATYGQTFEALATPMPEPVMANLNITALGPWTIMLLNTGNTQPTIPLQAALMQFPTVHWVDSSLALSILTTAQAASPDMRIAQVITIGTGVAGVFGGTGIIAMSKAVLGDLAGASLTANYLGTQLKTLAPNIGPLTATLCPSTLSIAPGGAFQCTMFADPNDAATPAIGPLPVNNMGMAMSQIPVVPRSAYRKHGVFGLGHKTLIVVHPPIHATFRVQ
jgi:hypothetical protein